MNTENKKKIIVGTLLAITLSGCFAISMEIIANISEQAEISAYSSENSLDTLSSLNPEFILKIGYPENKAEILSYDVKNKKMSSEEIADIARLFGLNGEFEYCNEKTGEMRIIDNSYEFQRQFSYYSKSGAIVYSIPDKQFPNSVEEQPVLPSKKETIKIVDEFLKKTDTYQKDAFVKNVEVNQKQQIFKPGVVDPEESYDVTIAVRYARNLDGTPVYGDEFSVIIGDSGEVVGMVKNFREVEPAGNVELRKAQDAYEDLCRQNTVYPVNFAEYDTITINNISLGYWMEPRIYIQDKVVPVYVFSGNSTRGELTDSFTGYVYAKKS